MEKHPNPSDFWYECFSKGRNMIYYYNLITKESVWDKPKGVEIKRHESAVKDNSPSIMTPQAQGAVDKNTDRQVIQKNIAEENSRHTENEVAEEVLKNSRSSEINLSESNNEKNCTTSLNQHKSHLFPRPKGYVEISSEEEEDSEERVQEVLKILHKQCLERKAARLLNNAREKGPFFQNDNTHQFVSKKGNYMDAANNTTRQLVEVSKKLNKISEQEIHTSNLTKRPKSKNSRLQKNKTKQFILDKAKPPIQDKVDKIEEKLLKKQLNYSKNETPETETSTPIQSQQCWKKPILKQISVSPLNDIAENSSIRTLKRLSSSSQDEVEGNRLECGILKPKQVKFGEMKRHSFDESVGTNRIQETLDVQRHSLESGIPVKDQITFGCGKSNSVMSVDTNSTVEENKPYDLRAKLQQKKKEALSNSKSDSSSSQMDWEACSVEESHKVAVNCDYSKKSQVKEDQPSYSRVYLVCDTSALIDDPFFIEKLINNGYLGLPIYIVIPFVVFDELDNLKKNTQQSGQNARNISRIINANQSKDHLVLQEGGKKRKAVGSLELKSNDDLVLNCCLQIREESSEDEIVVLMTQDVNLANKGHSFKVMSCNWNDFRKWARGYRDFTPLQSSKRIILKETSIIEDVDLNMEVDVNTNLEMNTSPLRIDPPLKNASQIQNCTHSHFGDVISEFQTFLHNVLDEAIKKEHGNLAKNPNVNKIRPHWTLMNYILEVKQRWFIITSSMLSNKEHDILVKIIASIKKKNSGEVFTIDDMDKHCNLCEDLANIIKPYFPQYTEVFLRALKSIRQDWKKDYSELPSTSFLENVTEVEVHPVNMALQNIYNYLHSYYENLNTQVESNKSDEDIKELLSIFYNKISDVESAIENVYMENRSILTCNNQKLLDLYNFITNFSGVRGSPLGFEIVVENFCEFFQDISYRRILKEIIAELANLKCLARELVRKGN